ncbi:MAG: carboxypeptidase regulatory-like domain-containing protein [Cytophagaceae bacterium]|nr:MAG: carboxypeptidase regulatory-like domain-containing protein [Cytophagaceae bacterium]
MVILVAILLPVLFRTFSTISKTGKLKVPDSLWASKSRKPMGITVLNQQGQPVEGVVIMVVDGPVSVPDIASMTDANGKGSLGQLSVPGEYTLLMSHGQKQQRETIQFQPGQSVTVQVR